MPVGRILIVLNIDGGKSLVANGEGLSLGLYFLGEGPRRLHVSVVLEKLQNLERIRLIGHVKDQVRHR